MPDDMPVSVKLLPDAWDVEGVTAHEAADVATTTGIVVGVPVAAVLGFVSVAWAVMLSVAPTFIVGEARDAVT